MISLITIIFVISFMRCGISLSEEVEESFPKVTTPLGPIEGYYKTSLNGRRYEAYEGIPYAQPPTGESRFEVPRPVTPWNGVLMAKQTGLKCLQYNQYPCDPVLVVEGSEDCLYMNIYTPIRNDGGENRSGEITGVPNTNLQPVIFYIHGGAFQFGSAREYGPKFLLDRNVTLVTINYRVGPLGFLSTEDETVPGNMGLKDQVIALRWVKDNIEFFGGDPSKVTIFGQSAGGASVHYHYLSNQTTGLFRGGMSLSGVALNCWSQAENSLDKAKRLAAIVGCQTESVQGMVNCLKARPGHQIVEAVGKFMPWLYNPYSPFGPVVEKGGSDESTFIDRPPVEILANGEAQDVPWITGLVSEEGLYPAAHFIANEKLLEDLNDNWEAIAPHLLDFNHTIPKTDHPRVARLIKQHYMGTSPIGRSSANQTVQMVGDRLFVYDIETAARLQARANRGSVRFYYFSYRGAKCSSEVMSGGTENFGVSHEDDVEYVMDSFLDTTTTPQDREMQKKLIDLWVSFATDGTPDVGIEWPEVSPSNEEFHYLHIAGPKEFSIKESPLKIGERNFWRTLGFQENLYVNRTL